MEPSSPAPFAIGGHLAIDFVNSVATPHGTTIDWLRDGQAAMGWFASLAVFPESALRDFQQSHSHLDLDRAAAEARQLREWLRGLLAQEPRLRTSPGVAEKLNQLMSHGSAFHALRTNKGKLKLQDYDRLESRCQLLVPIAKAIAHLMLEEDLDRVRACEGAGCALWFLDRTKPGRRRFCSPEICGNRAKVAAFRSRQRKAER
jgi:predicted RNA-binding Zn ribbon-like protein